ncbi:hypothetical protein ZWY2020_056199 [Hordeum vulgare]|nr:hypothetical protein ZWY2020_056199 [Hordeum vulgare]
MGCWNRISSAGGLLKPLAGVPFASMPGAGAAYFLVGSALGVFAMLQASESEVRREWAFSPQWAALSRSVGAQHMLVVMSLLFLAAKVWFLGKRCDAVEGLVGSAGATVLAVRVRGVVCTLLRQAGFEVAGFELEQEADREDEDFASEVTGAEEGKVERLRRRLVRERMLKEAALEELEKERRAAASSADEAMAKIACVRNEKALVEREAKQFREMAEQKQMYDRQRRDAVEGLVVSAGATVQAVRVRGVVCAVCGTGTKARALKKGSSAHFVDRARFGSCFDKPVLRSLASELEQAAGTEDEDVASEMNGAEEGNMEQLRRRLVRERRLKEMRAAASVADEAIAKALHAKQEGAGGARGEAVQ